MTEHWTDRLSEHLDGGLSPAERAALEAHLGECASCRAVLEDLRRLKAVASSLEDVEPGRDLWPGILENIRAGDDTHVLPLRPHVRPPRRVSFSLPQLAAAAVLMVALSGAFWLAGRNAARGPATATIEPAGPAAVDPALDARLVATTEQSYDAAISQLENELASRRGQLDTATIAVVERSLSVIDAAIAEARAALARDPSNVYLYRHLDNTLMRKIDLLRRATTLRPTQT